MDRRYLVDRVNERALSRYNRLSITDDIFDDILEAKIIRTPEKHGRKRNWTKHEYRRALEIVRLRWLGVYDLGETRFIFWLKRFDVPFLTGQFDDREILCRAYRRLVNQIIKPIHSSYPSGTNSDPSGWPAKSVLRRMGPLDRSLVPVVQYRDDELLDAYKIARFALGSGSVLLFAVRRIFDNIVRLPFFQRFGVDNIATKYSSELKEFPSLFRSFLSGSENTREGPERSIREATPEQFETARRILATVTRLFILMGFRKLANSLLHPTWRIAMFVFLLHAIFRASKNGRLASLFDPQEAKLIEAHFSIKSAN